MLSRRTARLERGVTTVQVLVILVPVLFAFMGFAIDLGRMYMVKGELQQAANAAALAAAGQLLGSDIATDHALAAAQAAVSFTDNYGNRFDYGAITVGESNGLQTSELQPLTFFDTAAAAIGSADASGGEAGGQTAKYVRVRIQGDAPLIFFSFLPIAQERRTPIVVEAVAGVSAPLCTPCNIDPLAIAAIDPSDTRDFGFLAGMRYTFYYSCTNGSRPILAGSSAGVPAVPYVLVNRYDESALVFTAENSQAYRLGAQGMLPSTNRAMACMAYSDVNEVRWVSATPPNCSASNPPDAVKAYLCGLATRFDTVVPDTCSTGIDEVDAMSQLYNPDSQVDDIAEGDYASYTGNGRRIITVAVTETLDANAPVLAIGYRQFLVEPIQDATNISPGDSGSRFLAMYLGSVAPLKQGWVPYYSEGNFQSCPLAYGPGKVVLHK